MAEQQLNLRFRVTDDGSVVLDKISKNIQKVSDSAISMGRSISIIKWDAIVNLGSRLESLGSQAVAFLDIGAKAKQTGEVFDKVTTSMGINAQSLIADMKEAGAVFVEESGLMVKAQRALVEGLAPDQIVKLMESSRVAARFMGVDVEESFNRIMEAVISLRTRGLKQAFPMDDVEVMKQYASTLGATAEDLNEYGKRQALVNEILRQTVERLQMLGPLEETAAERIQKAKSAWGEFYEVISKYAGVGFSAVWNFAKKSYENMKDIGEYAPKAAAGVKEVVQAAATTKGPTSDLLKILAPEKDWIKNYIEGIDQERQALNELGVVSERFYVNQAQWAQKSFENVKAAFLEGKVSANDYKNALIAVTATMTKATGEDTAKKVSALFEESQKQIDAISKEDPDRAKKVQAIIDQWMEARSKITQTISELELSYKEQLDRMNQMKIKPGVDTSSAMSALSELQSQYETMKSQIESNPIQAMINVGGGGGGGGGVGAGWNGLQAPPGWIGEGGTTYNVDFTGSASPTKPLSETLNDLMGQFTTWEEMMVGLEANIKFTDMSISLKRLAEQLAKVRDVMPSINRMVSLGGGDISAPFDPFLVRTVLRREWDLISEMDVIRLEIAKAALGMMPPNLSGERLAEAMKSVTSKIGADVPSWRTYNRENAFIRPYQGGTDYVPQTGLALVHKGEKIIPAGGATSINITQNISGAGDPRSVADAVVKALKYDLHGELKHEIFRGRT